MAALDTADRQEGELAQARSVRLKDKIATLREQMAAFKALEPVVRAAPGQQVSLTDPDARSMATSGRGSGVVGYNVQAAVDAKHHLIVAHEVTNVGNDRAQLANMAGQAKAAMGTDRLDVLADRGYFSGEEVLACKPLGVTPYVPKPLTSGSKAKGRFGKQDFVYLADDDVYRCPAGERLTRRFSSVEDGKTLHTYWTTRCGDCPLKPHCTSGRERRIKRWEHEAVIDAMQERLDRMPHVMSIRRAVVEHPFGTLKAWMGASHFRTRTLDKVRTEMSFHVLAYNLKRMIAILLTQPRPIADTTSTRRDVCFRGQTGHDPDRVSCLHVTQSGKRHDCRRLLAPGLHLWRTRARALNRALWTAKGCAASATYGIVHRLRGRQQWLDS
jgi:hypothetical protein